MPRKVDSFLPVKRAIIFDAVGTLLEPYPPAAIIYAKIGRKYGSQLSADEITLRFRAAFLLEEEYDRNHNLRTSERREEKRWRNIVAGVLNDVSAAEACFRDLFERFRDPLSWRCQEDAGRVLATLGDKGYSLGLASNFDSRLRSVVAGIPALKPLRHLIISSEVGWRKPAPEFFAALCSQVNLQPQQILYVGDDWVNDFEGGRAVGLRTILFDPGQKKPWDAISRIGRLSELVGLLDP